MRSRSLVRVAGVSAAEELTGRAIFSEWQAPVRRLSRKSRIASSRNFRLLLCIAT